MSGRPAPLSVALAASTAPTGQGWGQPGRTPPSQAQPRPVRRPSRLSLCSPCPGMPHADTLLMHSALLAPSVNSALSKSRHTCSLVSSCARQNTILSWIFAEHGNEQLVCRSGRSQPDGRKVPVVAIYPGPQVTTSNQPASSYTGSIVPGLKAAVDSHAAQKVAGSPRQALWCCAAHTVAWCLPALLTWHCPLFLLHSAARTETGCERRQGRPRGHRQHTALGSMPYDPPTVRRPHTAAAEAKPATDGKSAEGLPKVGIPLLTCSCLRVKQPGRIQLTQCSSHVHPPQLCSSLLACLCPCRHPVFCCRHERAGLQTSQPQPRVQQTITPRLGWRRVPPRGCSACRAPPQPS